MCLKICATGLGLHIPTTKWKKNGLSLRNQLLELIEKTKCPSVGRLQLIQLISKVTSNEIRIRVNSVRRCGRAAGETQYRFPYFTHVNINSSRCHLKWNSTLAMNETSSLSIDTTLWRVGWEFDIFLRIFGVPHGNRASNFGANILFLFFKNNKIIRYVRDRALEAIIAVPYFFPYNIITWYTPLTMMTLNGNKWPWIQETLSSIIFFKKGFFFFRLWWWSSSCIYQTPTE